MIPRNSQLKAEFVNLLTKYLINISLSPLSPLPPLVFAALFAPDSQV